MQEHITILLFYKGFYKTETSYIKSSSHQAGRTQPIPARRKASDPSCSRRHGRGGQQAGKLSCHKMRSLAGC